MKKCLKPLTASLLLLGMMTIPGFAAAESNADINARTEMLEKQLAKMQSQLAALKSQKSQPSASMVSNAPQSEIPESGAPSSGNGPSTLPSTGVSYLPVDFDVPGQSFVSTGPYIGVPLEYSGSNLIINTPSINQDV